LQAGAQTRIIAAMRRQAPNVSLVLACYNEAPHFAQSIREFIAVLKRNIYSWEIIFVDDHSGDATPELVAAACRKDARLRALYHKVNHGRGRTVADGIRAARGKVVGFIDIDCEVSPVYIPQCIDRIMRDGADVVVGKRIYKTHVASLFREILSVGYQALAQKIVDTGGIDTESGYKFFQRRRILPVLAKTKHPGWFWDTEIIVRARRAGLRVSEEPVLFVRREDKKSTVQPLRDVVNYLVSLWRFRRELSA
jgi:hypothetical protein